MAFPGPNAQIYHNEAGEVTGWDYPSDELYEESFEDQERRYQLMVCDGCGCHPEDCDCERQCERCGCIFEPEDSDQSECSPCSVKSAIENREEDEDSDNGRGRY